MDSLTKDFVQAVRGLRKSPVFTIVALMTLALGIGANTAIFSLADLIIRRPVALPQMHRLAVIEEQSSGSEDAGISPANYFDFRDASKSFDRLAAYQYWSASDDDQTRPEELHGVKVTSNFFGVVGIGPTLGRTFSSGDHISEKSDEVIISNALWKQRFGGDAAAIGKSLRLNNKPYTIIGIMPPRATFPLGAPEFWVPLAMDSGTRAQRHELELQTVGSLRRGIDVIQARAELETLWRRLAALYPAANQNRSLNVLSLHDHIVLDYNRQFSLLMLGASGFVLLIVCANLATLQLARGLRRQSEIAIRTALGASRWRLFRQLLVESMTLALAGGALGVFLAIYGVALMRRTLPSEVRWFCDVDSLSVNLAGLLFTMVVAIIAGLLTGLAPSWQQSKTALGNSLIGGGRIVGCGSHRWRSGFVIGQTALAMVLLIGAALMVKGFSVLVRGPENLAPEAMLTFHLTLPETRYAQPQKVVAFQRELLQRLSTLPNVRLAALASGIPYSSYEANSDLIVGTPRFLGSETPVAMPESVSLDYFRTMNIAVRDGRAFNASDTPNSMPVCIVSRSMAHRLWPGHSALGQQLRIASEKPADASWLTVVGVVDDVQHEIYDRSFRSILYRPYEQAPPRTADLALRVEGNPLQLVSAVRSEIRELDPDLALENIELMSELIATQASGLQFVAVLMAAFGVVAVILAAVGLYGVMSNGVTERWHEIAIRIALGALPSKLLVTVMGQGLLLVAIGTTLGSLSGFALAKGLSSLIYGVTAWDTEVFLFVPTLLLSIALLSCYLPARRVTQMDTMATLRWE
ncbi:MAG: ABC transporter permease [Acidobacteriaceae bacterium]|nr:ABC transporter permease [Acidobacteriaceae bacterium]